jgi:alpha-glucosidase
MPWTSAAPMGGFTTAPDAWLPMDPAHLPLSIQSQDADDGSALHFARRVIAARKGSEALKTGACIQLAGPDNVLAFDRVAGGERVRCVFELGGLATRFEDPVLAHGEPLFLGGGAVLDELGLDLPGSGVAIIRL